MPTRRKKPIKKQEPEKISKKMAAVRPARDQASGRKQYDHGYKPAPEKDPWQDEGYPES